MRVSVAWLGAGVIVAAAIGASSAGAQTPPPSGDNVTVVGKRPDKPCNEHDAGCILAVAKEVWTRYPAQVERFCNHQIGQAQAQTLLLHDIASGGMDSRSGQNSNIDIPSALKTVCDYKPGSGQAFDRSVQTWAPWAAVPSAAEITAAYPKAALGLADGGDAKLYCDIDAKGRLYFCTVSQESPDRKDFGPAALKLSHRFVVRVDPAHPRPASANWVDISIHFANPSPSGAAIPAQPIQIVHPDWLVLPDSGKTASLFPAAAHQAGVQTGVGRVDCRVGDDGGLGDCKVVDEEPAGLGFGAAALAVAPDMHANLWSRDGLRTPGAHVVAPLRFNADDAQKSGS